MGPAAALIVVLGIVFVIYSFMERAKAQRVTKAPLIKTGSLGAQPGGSAVSVEGNVACPQPLIAPFSGMPCLYYSIKCTAEWKVGETKKTKELANVKMAAAFLIDDGTGPAWIKADQGGTFEPTQSKSETKGTGLLGGITGKELLFGQYVVSTAALDIGTKYTVKEEVLPLLPRLYVCGSANGGVITEPSGLQSLIISNKTRDHLLASALKTSKTALIGGIAAVVVGGVLGVISRVTAASASASTSTPAPSALVTTESAALTAVPTVNAAPTVAPVAAALPTSAALATALKANATPPVAVAHVTATAAAPSTVKPAASAANAVANPATPVASAPKPPASKASAAPSFQPRSK